MVSSENKTIVMIGLMGAGKTSIGRRLAKELQLPFVDIDQEIEKEQGLAVSEIFDLKGEKEFRDMELKTIKRVLEGPRQVMATGGGAFINDEIRKLIKEKAISVWLKADIDVLVERVSRKNTRPLLEKGDKKAIMADLMAKRYPIYEEADIIVQSDDGPHNIVVDKIINKIRLD